MRHLVQLTRTLLGNDIILYTTDPPPYIANGTLPGDALFSCALLGTLSLLSDCDFVGLSLSPLSLSLSLYETETLFTRMYMLHATFVWQHHSALCPFTWFCMSVHLYVRYVCF